VAVKVNVWPGAPEVGDTARASVVDRSRHVEIFVAAPGTS
jgi:hypothetical protein